MRLHFRISAINRPIPFDHQHLLTGTIYKWIGRTDEHGKGAPFSFSRLEGATVRNNQLHIVDEASFFFSSVNDELIKKLIKGVQQDPFVFHGLSVKEIVIQEDPDLTDRDYFYVASPIFIKRKESNGNLTHILYNDERSSGCFNAFFRAGK